MQHPESTFVAVEQAWPEPGSLKPRSGHHLEPLGSRAYSSAVPRVISLFLNALCSCLVRRAHREHTDVVAVRGLAPDAQSSFPQQTDPQGGA